MGCEIRGEMDGDQGQINEIGFSIGDSYTIWNVNHRVSPQLPLCRDEDGGAN